VDFIQKSYPCDSIPAKQALLQTVSKALSPSNRGFESLLGLDFALRNHGIKAADIRIASPFYLKQKYWKLDVELVDGLFVVSGCGHGDELLGASVVSINRTSINDWIGQYLKLQAGSFYTQREYVQALETFGSWIGGMLQGDSMVLVATDFYTKQIVRKTILPIDYQEYTKWRETCCKSMLSSSRLEESGAQIVYLNPALQSYSQLSDLWKNRQSAPVILDLRYVKQLALDTMLLMASEFLPLKRPNFYIKTVGLSNSNSFGAEVSEFSSAEESSPELPVVLVGPKTGDVASILASFLYDEKPECLTGAPTSVPYEGGFLADQASIYLCNRSIEIKIPTSRIHYMGSTFPLRDRGLLPETLFVQTWEDYILKEDTPLNSLVDYVVNP
jgi:hypothetical protein